VTDNRFWFRSSEELDTIQTRMSFRASNVSCAGWLALWLIRMSSNPLLLLALLVLLAVFLHLILVRIARLSAKTWKKMEYVIVGIAILAVIPLAGNVRTWSASWHLSTAESRAIGAFERLRETIMWGHRTYICREFQRSEYSPEDFDRIVAEYHAACDWYGQVAKVLPNKVDPEFGELTMESLPPLLVTDSILVDSLADLRVLFEEYAARREDILELRRTMASTVAEEFYQLLAPLLLMLAAALQITKITADRHRL